jgi:hypothetical protein
MTSTFLLSNSNPMTALLLTQKIGVYFQENLNRKSLEFRVGLRTPSFGIRRIESHLNSEGDIPSSQLIYRIAFSDNNSILLPPNWTLKVWEGDPQKLTGSHPTRKHVLSQSPM